jgi:hypothetical protein
MYYSQYRKQISKGKKAEEIFEEQARVRGYKILAVTDEQDKFMHIDTIVFDIREQRIAMIDVKSMKKYGFIVELQNNLGYKGWIYGRSDMIAVHRGDKFLIFKREDILNLVNKNVNHGIVKTSVPGETKEPYTIYNRPEWKDRWVIVKEDDLLKLKHNTWITK